MEESLSRLFPPVFRAMLSRVHWEWTIFKRRNQQGTPVPFKRHFEGFLKGNSVDIINLNGPLSLSLPITFLKHRPDKKDRNPLKGLEKG